MYESIYCHGILLVSCWKYTKGIRPHNTCICDEKYCFRSTYFYFDLGLYEGVFLQAEFRKIAIKNRSYFITYYIHI